MSNWNAPLCNWCWNTNNPDRVPVRVLDPDTEMCSNCGQVTESGIYIRLDPVKQKFPARG